MSKKLKKNSSEKKPIFSLECDSPSGQANVSNIKNMQQTSVIDLIVKEKTIEDIEPKLSKLKENVSKLFKKEFVDSLAYLIKLEHNPQSKFEANLRNIEWKQLDYFMQQLKKICKNKKHILTLIHAMRIEEKDSKIQVAQNKNEKSSDEIYSEKVNESQKQMSSSELLDAIYDYSNLINEVESQHASMGDCFSLIGIMIRLLYKLINSTLSNDVEKIMSQEEMKIINICLILLSCLADFSYHEEIRIQVISDSNLKCLFQIFGSKTLKDLDDSKRTRNDPESLAKIEVSPQKMHTIERVKRLWSKMCRLLGNICLEKGSKKIRNLFTSEFLKSLCKCLEQQQMVQSSKKDFYIEINDLDFYHSLLRFLRYGCELACCKSIILENRILALVCKIIHKLTININSHKLNDTTTSARKSLIETKSKVNNEEKNNQVMSKLKELIKINLIILESWPMPLCSEYCNQVIEGNSIETLLHIYNDETNFTETIQNPSKSIENPNPPTSSIDLKKTCQTFNFTEFSFNLMYKLCYDFPSCRSEFGRVGGLVKIVNKIETYHSLDPVTKNISQQEYERLVEMICLSCKEVTNRSRFREQGFLINLVKHQQRLFKLNLNYNSRSSRGSFESKLHNKLLVALCYFVYDQDSLNILLSNGLIDSLLAYLNESLENMNDESEDKRSRSDSPTSNRQNFKTQFENLFQDSNKKLLCLRKLLVFHKDAASSSNRKRKSPDLTDSKNSLVITKPKRRKQNDLSPPPPPLTPTFPIFPSPSYQSRIVSPNSYSPEFQFTTDQKPQQSTSPTGSYCSLSPQPNAFSPALSLSSPTQLPPRSHSAIMFSNASLNQTYQNSFSASNLAFSNLSPSSSSNELSFSPYLYSPNSFNEAEQQINNTNIQFSPSIKNENSSDEDEETIGEEDSENDQKDNDCVSEKMHDVSETKLDEKEPDQESLYSKYEIPSSPIQTINCEMKKLTKSSSQYIAQQSIESINRTEACVFYVLGQLSHGDKPSTHILNNFDSILICLLNYLKNAKVRNPRALRILNRLTKNQFCFYQFVLTQFPYKIKKIFYDGKNPINSSFNDESTSNTKPTLHHKKIEKSSSTNSIHTNRLISSTFNVSTQEKDIEKEMNVYLNSNKAFFDAHTYFPSFESIEFTLCNNLKSLCMSSGDHGFSCLTQMMKNPQRKNDRISCALVAPFILRNCRALNYIMVELNGIDLVLDALFLENQLLENGDEKVKSKAIVCIQRILSFVGYKRDLKQINDNFALNRDKFYEKHVAKETAKIETEIKNDDLISFEFNQENEIKYLTTNRQFLTKASEYFNALLNGNFSESLNYKDPNSVQTLKMNDVSYDAFQIIVELIQLEETDNNEFLLKNKLSFDLCIELILTCDKFCLIHLKDLFISILACNYFNLSTWPFCFHLAYSLNNAYLANSSVDYLLNMFRPFPIRKSKLSQVDESIDIYLDQISESLSETVSRGLTSNECAGANESDLINFEEVFNYLLKNLNELSQAASSYSYNHSCETTNLIKEHFRKILKNALSEIIKKNYWKF